MYIIISGGCGEIRDGVPTLAEMQQIVGGYIEGFTLGYSNDGLAIRGYCNEEAKIIPGFRPNVYVHALGDMVYGDIVIVGEDKNGDTFPLAEAEIERLYIEPAMLRYVGQVAYDAYVKMELDKEEELPADEVERRAEEDARAMDEWDMAQEEAANHPEEGE